MIFSLKDNYCSEVMKKMSKDAHRLFGNNTLDRTTIEMYC
jgi:hypothetical protein